MCRQKLFVFHCLINKKELQNFLWKTHQRNSDFDWFDKRNKPKIPSVTFCKKRQNRKCLVRKEEANRSEIDLLDDRNQESTEIQTKRRRKENT